MSELKALEGWVAPLLDRLSDGERRKLAMAVARDLRAANAGMRMFQKMGAAKNLKAMATPTEAMVGFVGRAERIARVHHFGLSDRVMPGGPTYRYPARELLGISSEQLDRTRALLAKHLAL